jgi:stage II sporulation protein AA (anti-sigma F factor antagonist)
MREMTVTAMTVRSEQTQHLRLVGELAYDTSMGARNQFWHALGQGVPRVVVDVSQLSLMDSSGLSMLVAAWQHLSREGRRFEVHGMTGQPARLLAMTGCDSLFVSKAGAEDLATRSGASPGWPWGAVAS